MTKEEGKVQLYNAEELENALLETPFVKEATTTTTTSITPLRICCYGSSSAKTPVKFLKEAWNLGYILAKRGHTCVNGAGSYGCMAAMNDGADAGNGHIVGVIHEMFIVDGNDWYCNRDGGAHRLFKGKTGMEKGDTSSSNVSADAADGPTREMLVAGGKDLQERKRLLVEGADGLIVLPGGPGTWDELWEMSCARNLGLTNLPIVCVSVDGYYSSFRDMLDRAFKEGLVKNKPEDVVHFVSTPEEAIRWIEQRNKDAPTPLVEQSVKKRASVLKRASFMSGAPGVLTRSVSWFSNGSSGDGDGEGWAGTSASVVIGTVAFVTGVAVGLFSAAHAKR